MRIFIPIVFLIIVSACGTTQGPKKPSASGKAGELLVVMSETHWEGLAGEMVRNVFLSAVPMLPQPEANFDPFHVAPTNFGKLFETHRNLFFVEFDPSLEKGKIEVNRNVWSYPQMVINVTVPNEESLQRIMDNNAQQFREYYIENERIRLINAYRRMINLQARTKVQENLNLDITVPEGYFLAEEDTDFIWLRQTGTREDLELGVLISVRPYTDPAIDFNHDIIWQRRNEITKKYIPGSFEGTYMTTYTDIEPIFREINFNGLYAVEARGLWRVEGDFMGGPFINITFVDEKNGRLVTLDGFVYAPKFDKRDYLRQVEALLYSVKVFDENENTDAETDSTNVDEVSATS